MPEPKVEFTGRPRRETVWEAERQNLPRPVRPGETYRDIGIRLRITSVFADIDRIVAEALGEVPSGEDAPPQPPPQTAPPGENISPPDAERQTSRAPRTGAPTEPETKDATSLPPNRPPASPAPSPTGRGSRP